LSGGSNPGRASSGGRSAGGGRSTTSGRRRGQGGMPPTEGSSGHPKKKYGAISGAGESGSTASRSSAKRPRNIIPRNEKLSSLARTRLRKEACDFFPKTACSFWNECISVLEKQGWIH
jgi:hypothetical protein